MAGRSRLKTSWNKFGRLGCAYGQRRSSKGQRLLLGSPRADTHRRRNSFIGHFNILDCGTCDPAIRVQLAFTDGSAGADNKNSAANFPEGGLESAWRNWLLRDASRLRRIVRDRFGTERAYSRVTFRRCIGPSDGSSARRG